MSQQMLKMLSRSDEEFLIKFITEAKKAGADRIRYCDTVE